MENHLESSARLRFYELDLDPRIDSICEFVNEDRAFFQHNRLGMRQVLLPGTQFKYHIGLPVFAETPSFVLGSRAKNCEPLDFYSAAGFLLISGRFKALIDTVDPEAIEAAECEAKNSKGEPLPSYWWIDVVRVLDQVVDEERSALKYQADSAFACGDEVDKLLYMDLQDIIFRHDVVGGAQMFRILRYTARSIIGQQLADKIRASGLTGMSLTPLQPPLPDEAKNHLAFLNYPYWTNKGYGQ